MPAKSKKQQKFMGMVHAAQKGDLKTPSPEVKIVAKSMKKKDTKDFASTKHKGLPNKVKNETIQNVVFTESMTRARFVNEEYKPGFKELQPADLIGVTISDSEYENGALLLFPPEEDQSGYYEIGCGGGADLEVEGALPHHMAEIIDIDTSSDYANEFDIVFDDMRITVADPTGGEGIEVIFIYG